MSKIRRKTIPQRKGGLRATSSATRAGARSNRERSRVIDRLEAIITQDIGGRGLAVDPTDNLVTRCHGNLASAARHLASEGSSVAIVTGFFIAHAAEPSIETDGPCGAIALAWLLSQLGYYVTLVTDPLGERAIAAGLAAASFESRTVSLHVFPFESPDPDSADRTSNELEHSLGSFGHAESFFRTGPGKSLTHLIAIERAGPSWFECEGAEPEAGSRRFATLCPPEHQNQVHNFRGQIITGQTAKTHLLFDFIRHNSLPVRTIGLGDGGNEIGMGSIPWQVIHANIPSGLGARIACRVATDWTIACGVSNWGAYALGTAASWLRGRAELLRDWTDERERAVLAALTDAGAVDGVTAEPTMSVDGMAIEQHLAIWGQIREAARS
jgi:hypothetical protein